MNYKQLKDCISYCILQAETSNIPVLDDATCKGFDSEEYHDFQINSLLNLLDAVKYQEASEAASKAFADHVERSLKVTRR